MKACEVGAVLVFKHVLAIFDEDAGMHAWNASVFAAMWSQVHVGEDVAYSIFASDQNVIFAAQVKLLVVRFHNQASCQGRHSCDGRADGCGRCCRCGRGIGSSCSGSGCAAEHTAAVRAESLSCWADCSTRGADLAASISGGSGCGLWSGGDGSSARQWLSTLITEGGPIGIFMA